MVAEIMVDLWSMYLPIAIKLSIGGTRIINRYTIYTQYILCLRVVNGYVVYTMSL